MRLTTLGRGFLGGGLVLVAAGALLGVPVVVTVGVFMLTLVGGAAVLVAEVPDVSVARAAIPTEVDRGGPAEIRLRFRSMSTRRPRPLTVIETVDGQQRLATIGPIPAQGTDELAYAVPTGRRGVVRAGPLVVRRSDPFGLVTADRRFTSTCTVSVRPRHYALRMLPSGRQRDLEGPTRERSEGTASFHQLREYAPGDDLRRIHWRSTARTGQLLVKEMIDTTRPELLVVLDNRTSAISADDFEHAVDIAASIVRAAENEDFPTTLMFADGAGDIDLDGQPIPAVDRLTSVRLGDADSLAQLADVIVSRGRSLVFVTGEPSGTDLMTLAKLAVGFSPAYLVSVVAERHDPVVAPRGMRAIACADPEEFVHLWTSLS
jgi:uncharacterized protein (DUF58 family)